MEQRLLGRTGIPVSLLGMGGLFVSQVGGHDRDQACQAVRRALELGVNYVDTAPGYADSEEVLGLALAGASQPYLISTKLGGYPQPFNPKDRDLLRRSVENSLRLLKRDTIDILMIHEPDRPGQYDWWDSYDTYHGPASEVLAELRSEGIIRFTGLGGTTAYQLHPIIDSGNYDVVLTAFNYSLLWREAEFEILPAARRHNVGVVIGSPLQQGALSQRYTEVETGARWLSSPRQRQFQALYDFLDEIELPLPELALRWVISNPDISTTLMGARSVEEVEKNVAAVNAGPLPTEVLARLKEIAEMVPFRPFEEPFGLPFNRNYNGPEHA